MPLGPSSSQIWLFSIRKAVLFQQQHRVLPHIDVPRDFCGFGLIAISESTEEQPWRVCLYLASAWVMSPRWDFHPPSVSLTSLFSICARGSLWLFQTQTALSREGWGGTPHWLSFLPFPLHFPSQFMADLTSWGKMPSPTPAFSSSLLLNVPRFFKCQFQLTAWWCLLACHIQPVTWRRKKGFVSHKGPRSHLNCMWKSKVNPGRRHPHLSDHACPPFSLCCSKCGPPLETL